MIFKAKEIIEEIQGYGDTLKITCAGRANINKWGGRETPQIFVDEIEIKESSLEDF